MANTKITSANLDTLTTLTVDDITIDGSTISDSGDLTLDVGGDIVLDAAGGDIILKNAGSTNGNIVLGDATNPTVTISSGFDFTIDVGGSIILDADGTGVVDFKDGGTHFGRIENASSDFKLESRVQNKDIVLVGNDNGTGIEALRLDMSDAGTATFNHDIKLGDNGQVLFGAGNDLTIYHDASDSYIKDTGTGNLLIQGSDIYMGDTSNNHAFVIRASGNVGIGGGGTADTKLHLKDTGSIELRLEADSNNSGQEDCFIRFYTDGKTQEGIVGMDNNNSSTLFSGNTENAMVFGTVNNLPVVLATNNTERWQVEAGGKFYGTGTIQANTILMGGDQLTYGGASYGYIGTNSSSARFGYFRDSSNNYPAMIFNTGDDCHFSPHDSGVQVYFGSQGGDFGGNSSHNVRASSNLFMFNAGGSNGQFVFEANGHGMLSLHGESSTAVVINGHNSTGGSVNWIPHSSKGSNESHAHYGNNGDWYIRPASNSGTVYVKNYQAESDERLKENIEDITYGTDEILQLQPRKFNWIDNSEEQNGFIAQEVESVLPNFVSTGDMKIDGHEEEEGIKSVNYNSIVATLVKSVQELEARITELENG